MNEYYKNLPRKRMGAGVIFLNEDDEILIVKPSYRDHWSIPGGTVDEDESPRQGAIREVKEEIGLTVGDIGFLCTDYIQRENDEKNEFIQFMFYGGVLSDSEISNIKLDGKELIEFRFVPVIEAEKLFNHHMARRLPKCIDAIKTGTAVYLENGNFE